MTEPVTPETTADAFAEWAQSEGLLGHITEDECRQLAKAYMAGFTQGAWYGMEVQADAFSERLGHLVPRKP